jgi:plasmid stability protein
LIVPGVSVTRVQMDTTVRNLDEQAYRELKARAALEGRPIGETLSEAIRVYLRTAPVLPRDGSLAELRPEPYAAGTERLSEEIDAVVYGAS